MPSGSGSTCASSSRTGSRALAGERFDLIVCNPPYVAAEDRAFEDLRSEPRLALDGGTDGLDALRAVLAARAGASERGGATVARARPRSARGARRACRAPAGACVAAHVDLAGHARIRRSLRGAARPRDLAVWRRGDVRLATRAGNSPPERGAEVTSKRYARQVALCRRSASGPGTARRGQRVDRRPRRARLSGRAVPRDERHRPARVERLRPRRRNELPRQILYTAEDVGELKVEAAARGCAR